MRFSAISEFVFSCQRSERYCLLIALIVRRSGEIICKAPAMGPNARYSLAWGSWFPTLRKVREGWETRLILMDYFGILHSKAVLLTYLERHHSSLRSHLNLPKYCCLYRR